MADGRIHNQAAFAASPSYRQYAYGRQKMIWDYLKPAWDWGIAPTDLDGLVERNGNYLMFECKNKGAELNTGQKKAIRDLNLRHGFTVFVVTGFTESSVSELSITWPRRVLHESFTDIDGQFLLKMCRKWFDWVEGNSPEPRPVPLVVPKTPQEQNAAEWLAEYDAAPSIEEIANGVHNGRR